MWAPYVVCYLMQHGAKNMFVWVECIWRVMMSEPDIDLHGLTSAAILVQALNGTLTAIVTRLRDI
jgi:uncharacterized membrane protein